MADSIKNPKYIDTGTKEPVEAENKRLLQDIERLCKRTNYRKHNVLLIGSEGSGKSSVINTMLKLINGEFIPRAQAGSGNVLSNTLRLGRYQNCASIMDDFGEEDANPGVDSFSKEVFKTIWEHLPDLFDAAAMENRNDERTKEILRLLIGGYITPDTDIAQLEKLQTDKCLGYLPLIYCVPYDQYKMSRIIFACSCVSPIPYELIKCVREVLQEDDPNTGHKRYDSNVFLLITKYDLVDRTDSAKNDTPSIEVIDNFRNEDTSLSNSERETITPKEFETVESQLANAFVIKGMTSKCSLRWVSYNEDVGYDNPHIDNCSLKLLKYLTTPLKTEVGAKPVPTPLPDYWDRKVKAEMWSIWMRTSKYLNRQQVQSNYPLIFGVCVCVLAMIIWMMFGTVRKTDL